MGLLLIRRRTFQIGPAPRVCNGPREVGPRRARFVRTRNTPVKLFLLRHILLPSNFKEARRRLQDLRPAAKGRRTPHAACFVHHRGVVIGR